MNTDPLGPAVRLRLRLAFAGALTLFLGIGLASLYCLKASNDSARWVAHTYEVLRQLQGLSSTVHIAQRDERGYLLTPDPKVATRVNQSWDRVAARMQNLKELTKDNPPQEQRLAHLTVLLDEAHAKQERLIETASRDRQKAALQYASSANAREQSLERLDEWFGLIRTAEDELLHERTQSWQDSSLLLAVLLGIGTAFGTFLIILSGVWIRRDFERRTKNEAALRQLQEELEIRVRARTADLSRTTASLEAEVAERRATEDRLRESEKRYRMLFEDSPLPMEIFDPETLRYLHVNGEAQQLYGYTAREFQTMTLLDTRPPEEAPGFLEFMEKAKNQDAYRGTFVTRHKNGKVIDIDARVRTVEYGGRKARLKLVTDVTEHKRLETQLRQSQKIEAVGRLAGGIAHDFNNLLTVILGYSDTILSAGNLDDPIRERMLAIQAAGQRAANLTKQLLAFSRKQILKPQILDLNAVVSSISQMLRRLLSEDIRISLHLDSGIGKIQADPTQLDQVLVNLAVNARDAMPNGGQLVIETRNIDLDQETAAVQGVAAGRYVVLIVSDTGIGMNEETKARVFEPFFTTKAVGRGTGLGLSMVLGVVQQSGGTVTIYSEVGVGTTFKIYLPRLDAAAQGVQEPKNRQQLPVKTGATILLVEDEPSLRALAREVLVAAGYRVHEAANGKEALKLAESLLEPPDLVLTDVVMPEMSGLDLADELCRRWPLLTVAYTSGYTDHALLERNALPKNTPFLQKPYMPATLLDVVAKLLHGEFVNASDPSTLSEHEQEAEMVGER